MTNFRYHLVSLAAVFLALAAGLVLGTTALNGPTKNWLSGSVSSLRDDNEQLRDKVSRMESDAAKQQDFASEVAPATLDGLLANERIAIVSAGGADAEQVKGVAAILDHTRARNVGQLALSDAFTAPESQDTLTEVAEKHAPHNVEVPRNGNGVETVSALLAAALEADSDVTATDRDSIVEQLEHDGMITQKKSLAAQQATAVVLVTGEPYSGAESTRRNDAMSSLASEFGDAGPTVLAAPSADAEGGAVAQVLDDVALAESISTVDNVFEVQGQLATVLALPERIAGDTGHYGTGDAATSLVPKAS